MERKRLTCMHLVAISVILVILEADKRFAWTTSLRRISNSCQGRVSTKGSLKEGSAYLYYCHVRKLQSRRCHRSVFQCLKVIWASRAMLKASGGRRRRRKHHICPC